MASAEYRSLWGPKLFGDRLLEAGLITRTELDLALDHQRTGIDRQRLGRTLVELGILSDRDLIQMLGVHLAMPIAPFSIAEAEERAVRSVPAEVARRHRALPCRVFGGSLLVAVPDKVPSVVVEELEAVSGCPVLVYLSSEAEIDAALAKYYAHTSPMAREDSESLAPAPPGIDAGPDSMLDGPSTGRARLPDLASSSGRPAAGDEAPALAVVATAEESQKVAEDNARLRAELEQMREGIAALLDSLIDAARRLLARH
jgi:hypothetical protein